MSSSGSRPCSRSLCHHAASSCLSDRNLNILQYCPSADTWTLFETCDVHIRKQQMVSVEETIYIVGGCLHELGPTRRGSQSEDMLTVQSYNTVTRQWLYLKEIGRASCRERVSSPV